MYIKRNYTIYIFILLAASIFILPVHARYVGVTGLEITQDYVHVESAYPTSSVDGGYYRHYGCPYFVNRCPHCGGSLGFEQCDPNNGVIPGFTSIEGMYYCTWCDMDFSCISGMEHGSTGYCLYYYQPPQPEPEPETVENKTQKRELDVTVTGPLGRQHTFKIPHNFIKALKKGG